jgi:uncharacterized protein with NRDE domain
MCLLAFAWRCHQRYDLVFAGNRDEFHDRPTAPASWWPAGAGAPAVLAGRDLQAGGTWLGLREDGAFATVTNVREARARRRGGRSRGTLVTDFLLADRHGEYAEHGAPQESLARAAADGEDYADFNLLAGHLREPPRLDYVNNVERRIHPLDAGIHTLSNHRLDTPWPKSTLVGDGLQRLLAAQATDAPEELVRGLLELFADRTPAADDVLPDTGLPPDQERALSAPFIAGRTYGTRSTTVILCSRDGEVTFVEQSYGTDGTRGAQVNVRFRLRPAAQR